MNEIKLEFSCPMPFEELLRDDKARNPGIYIWGFMNKGKFIPYYVGKKEKSVYDRIKEHFQDIHNNNTYIIFEEDFYDDLSMNLKNLKLTAKPYLNLHMIDNKSFLNKLVYYNNENFLKLRYGSKVVCPCLLIKGMTSQCLDKFFELSKTPLNVQNTIDKIFTEQTLHISYCITHDINAMKVTDLKGFKKNLKDAETFVKFNMPNPTIGDSGSYTEDIKKKFSIQLPF